MDYNLLAGGCKGGDCCTPGNKCKDGDGDCDSYLDCLSGRCGEDNCDTQKYPTFQSNDDCCLKSIGNSNSFYNTKEGHPNIFFKTQKAFL